MECPHTLQARQAGSQPQPQLQIGTQASPQCSNQAAVRSETGWWGFLGQNMFLSGVYFPHSCVPRGGVEGEAQDTQVPVSGATKLMKTSGSKGRFQPCRLCGCHLHKGPVSLGLGILLLPK